MWYYLCENSTSSLGQGEASLEVCSSDTLPFAPSKLSHIADRYSSVANKTDLSQGSQFGMMSEHLTDDLGKDQSMSYAEDSLAKTYQLETTTETGSMASDQDCGPKCQESFVKWNPITSSWKTRQLSLFGGSEEFSATWPQWGIMQNGECWALTTPAALMQEGASGLLPTPCASDYKGGYAKPKKSNGKLRTDQYKHWCKILHGLTYPIPMHMEAMMGWPIGWTELKPLETGNAHLLLD